MDFSYRMHTHITMLRYSARLTTRTPTRTLLHSAAACNLFGGGKTASAPHMAPGNKLETVSNPVDLLKKNDILMYSQKPINYIELVKPNGFHLANNILITSPNRDGHEIGTLLLDTESYEVDLSQGGYKIVNGFIVEFDATAVLDVFSKIHPKPEIVVVGLGKKSRMLSAANRKFFADVGIQLEVGDSRHAARIYDLLATERPGVIGALLLPPNV